MHIAGFGYHVVITAEHKGVFGFKKVLGVFVKPFHPSKFIGEFLRIHRVAVRQINRCNPDAAGKAFDVTGLFVGFITGQGGEFEVDRLFRENGNAVICFLARHDDVVAEIFDFEPWKVLLDAFEFLQQRNIGRGFF